MTVVNNKIIRNSIDKYLTYGKSDFIVIWFLFLLNLCIVNFSGGYMNDLIFILIQLHLLF